MDAAKLASADPHRPHRYLGRDYDRRGTRDVVLGHDPHRTGLAENQGLLELGKPSGLRCGCIYEPEADRVILTPRGRDHGVDVVVIGHRANANMLIQVKTTTTGALDSEEAVRQLEGGRRFYENALGLKFTKMRVHTNVNKFSSRTLQAAKIYKTEALGFDWIESVLKKTPITRVDIITRNAQ